MQEPALWRSFAVLETSARVACSAWIREKGDFPAEMLMRVDVRRSRLATPTFPHKPMTQKDRTQLYVWTGALGIAATAVFLTKTFAPLPFKAHVFLCMAFGPMVAAGAPGMARYLKRGAESLLIDTAGRFAVIAGSFHLAMTCVQTTTLILMRERIAAADEIARPALRQILDGVFTVQLGLCFCWDLFIALATLMFSIAMIRRGGRLAALGGMGVLLGTLFLGMKLWTYPIPPAEAGLFDLGPGLGAWYLLFASAILATAREVAAIETAQLGDNARL